MSHTVENPHAAAGWLSTARQEYEDVYNAIVAGQEPEASDLPSFTAVRIDVANAYAEAVSTLDALADEYRRPGDREDVVEQAASLVDEMWAYEQHLREAEEDGYGHLTSPPTFGKRLEELGVDENYAVEDVLEATAEQL